MKKYDDIIDMPPFRSKKHAHMSMTDRAAQFSPFAALTGYDDAIVEMARLTEGEVCLADDEMQRLNVQLMDIMQKIEIQPRICITYFIPDRRKSGGKYERYTGNVKKIDMEKRQVVFTDKKRIDIEKIIEIANEP